MNVHTSLIPGGEESTTTGLFFFLMCLQPQLLHLVCTLRCCCAFHLLAVLQQ
mgnify:CR=1 FL=1